MFNKENYGVNMILTVKEIPVVTQEDEEAEPVEEVIPADKLVPED